MQHVDSRTISTSSEPGAGQATIVSALRDGDICDALELLRSAGAAALEGLSVLEDVLPLALTTIADLYDKYGVTGREGGAPGLLAIANDVGVASRPWVYYSARIFSCRPVL